MLMFKAKKVAALVLVVLFALTGNAMGAFAEQAVTGEPLVAVDTLLVEGNAASSEGLVVAVEAPAAEVPSAPEMPADPQHFDPLPVIYSVKFVAPDGSEYFILEVEEGERLEEPMFTPAVAGYTFEYWYEVVPVSEGSLKLGTAEVRIEFGTPVHRDYVIIAKLMEIPAQAETPVANEAGGVADEGAKTAQAEEAEKEARSARREERKQTAEIIEMVGARAAGELLSLEGIDIMIISDADPILEEEEDEEAEVIVDEEEAEASGEPEEGGEIEIDEDEVIVDEDDEEASDELEETEAVVIEEEEEETSEEVIEEEAVVEEEVTVEEEVVVEEDTEAAGGELDMADAAVPLAGCAVNVYTNHKPMMVEGETLEVWGELIGFDNVDVKVQWQYSDGGEWQDMPGANDLTYAVSATGDTVNYSWRLAVAVVGK